MRALIVLLALAGCAVPPTETSPTAPSGPGADRYHAAIEAAEAPFRVPGNFTPRLNETVQMLDVRVTPLEVLEDSRCPIDATCVWAGRVRVRVAVSGMGEQVMQIGRPVIVPGGQRLELVAVAPPNWSRPPVGVDPNAPKRFAFRLSMVE
jgi:hypothetical protein